MTNDCQHPVPAIKYGQDGALLCTACDTVMVPVITGVNPDVMWAVPCPECKAPRWWACQLGHGVSRWTAHKGRHEARDAALGDQP